MAPTADLRQFRAALIAIAIFSALSLAAALTSTGFLEADACTHYLYARNAFFHPDLFVNVWGRPLVTLIDSVPAHLAGRMGVRITSLLIAIAIALVAQAIAEKQGWRWPVLALIFTLAQPLVFLLSFSEMTELPFALLLALGFWAYQSRRFFWMAVAIGFSPLGRPEGFGFLILAAIALVLHRRWWWIAVLALPLLTWNYIGWILYGRSGAWWQWGFPWLAWLKANWPYAQQSLYQPGPLWHFVALLPVVASPFVFPAMLLGGFLCLRRRSDILIAILPLLILIGHSLLYWRGKMASNGELRYMMVVAPFWGLLCARGWEWIFLRFRWRRPLLWASVAALVPILANSFWAVVPLRLQPDWLEAKQIADWYQSDDWRARFPDIATANPGILYFLNDDASRHIVEWRKDVIDSCPAGTILIWDPIYGVFNSDAARSIPVDELRRAGWQPIDTPWLPSDVVGGWKIFQSRPIH